MARFVSEWTADLVSKYEFVEKSSRRLMFCVASVSIIAISGRHILQRRFLHHELKIIGVRTNRGFAVDL
jgi:hypothetical protein